MKRLAYISVFAALACSLAACTVSSTTSSNESARQYLESWMEINHPGVQPSAAGLYILEDTPGTGKAWSADMSYVFADYTITSLDGTVSSTNNIQLCKQLGKYNPVASYEPAIWAIGNGYSYAGLDMLLTGMKVGGTRKAVIPCWLLTYDRMSKDEDYYKKDVSASHVIYTVTLRGMTDNLKGWCIDNLDTYVHTNIDAALDSSYYNNTDGSRLGFYFKSLEQPSDSVIPPGKDGYLLYIGRRLDGTVFDTNIADTAKVHGIWSASLTYEPARITFKSEYTSIQMDGSSSLVDGFQAALFRMHAYEKATTVFYYALGYGTTSKDIIPAYSSLRFDLQLIDE